MSLLKLKSKTEPLYKSKTIINYEDDIKKESLNPINSLKARNKIEKNGYKTIIEPIKKIECAIIFSLFL